MQLAVRQRSKREFGKCTLQLNHYIWARLLIRLLEYNPDLPLQYSKTSFHFTMATTTTHDTATKTHDLPLHQPGSQPYTSTETPKISDGRRNSQGEVIPSPTESWKPNFARKQSWNQEDLKRKVYMSELEAKKAKGQGMGFTEGGTKD